MLREVLPNSAVTTGKFALGSFLLRCYRDRQYLVLPDWQRSRFESGPRTGNFKFSNITDDEYEHSGNAVVYDIHTSLLGEHGMDNWIWHSCDWPRGRTGHFWIWKRKRKPSRSTYQSAASRKCSRAGTRTSPGYTGQSSIEPCHESSPQPTSRFQSESAHGQRSRNRHPRSVCQEPPFTTRISILGPDFELLGKIDSRHRTLFMQISSVAVQLV